MLAKDNFKRRWINPRQYKNTCYIVGGGPSLVDFPWELLTKNDFVVAINRSYEVLPQAKIIYFTDPDYWDNHKEGMRKHGGWMMRGGLHVAPWHDHCKTGVNPWGDDLSFRNKRLCAVVADSMKDGPDIYQWHLSEYAGFDEKWGYLRHGKNSAYAALNMMTMHFGFRKVYLLGLDMGWKEAGNKEAGTHWHDAKNHRIDPETIYPVMKHAYSTCMPWIHRNLIRVINVNPNNTLPMFEHQTIAEAFKIRK